MQQCASIECPLLPPTAGSPACAIGAILAPKKTGSRQRLYRAFKICPNRTLPSGTEAMIAKFLLVLTEGNCNQASHALEQVHAITTQHREFMSFLYQPLTASSRSL